MCYYSSRLQAELLISFLFFFFSGIVFVHCFIVVVRELSSGLTCVTFQHSDLFEKRNSRNL